jgi:hypothetical protein
MPSVRRTKKFDQEKAGRVWDDYMKGLIESIRESEEEGLKRGMSSFEIEVLWQQKMKEKVEMEKAKKKAVKEEE